MDTLDINHATADELEAVEGLRGHGVLADTERVALSVGDRKTP